MNCEPCDVASALRASALRASALRAVNTVKWSDELRLYQAHFEECCVQKDYFGNISQNKIIEICYSEEESVN